MTFTDFKFASAKEVMSLKDLRFEMEGAGVRSVNGTYCVVGFFNGALLFEHFDEEEDIVHYLFCSAPRKTACTHSTWVIVSSVEFPSPEHDVLFYTCKSTFIRGALPSNVGWEACPRESSGLAELLLPVPQAWGLVRTHGCVDVLVAGMIGAEVQEDERVGAMVENVTAKLESAQLCPAWAATGACAARFRACRLSHASSARYVPPKQICSGFQHSNGCIKTTYECNKLHCWTHRKIMFRAELLRMIPSLLVHDLSPTSRRAALTF